MCLTKFALDLLRRLYMVLFIVRTYYVMIIVKIQLILFYKEDEIIINGIFHAL